MKLNKGVISSLAAIATLACGPTILTAASPGPIAPYVAQEGWAVPPPEYKDVARQGYQDGIEGARKDFQNHRRPDVNNRDEYKHPKVPSAVRQDYRDAFQRGYQAGVDHLINEHR
ncbi:hypothetical protein [Granulicella sp. L60]|uniref:hypothetical protein n=1 Tax=Granulicella sp. L60 TaxID=1641866 RepID=UPI00131E17F6|nr:hypothetical protein [Granulicella sp. L60]